MERDKTLSGLCDEKEEATLSELREDFLNRKFENRPDRSKVRHGIDTKSLRLDMSLNDKIVSRYLETLNCPRSLSVYLLYKYGEHDQITDLQCSPEAYADAYSFRLALCATSLLKKAEFLSTTFDRDEVALAGFWDSEARCKVTNQRWSSRRFENDEWNTIHRVSRKILQIIGEKPNIDRWLDESSWGPGSTLAIKKAGASSFKKFRDERGLTVDAECLSGFLWEAFPFIRGRHFELELGDKLFVVPKDARKGRCILIQPGWNLYLQKGLGSLLRSKLRRAGLDLDTGAADFNRWAAWYSSKNGYWATIDLKAASDTISREVLREVLPPGWYRVLDLLRCRRSQDGNHAWEKFSSMGNGFTFELETLLFYAIACISCEQAGADDGGVSCFGDDIVIPVSAVSFLRRNLDLFGFLENPEKSFSSGYFRESCGDYWYDGINCKPIFLKRKVSVITDLYRIYNQSRNLAHSMGCSLCCDVRFEDFCRWLLRQCPHKLRFKIPEGFGDVGFISNFDEATPSSVREPSHSGWEFPALIDVSIAFETEEAALLLVRLTEHSDEGRFNAIDQKQRTYKRVQRLRCHEWYNLGPWI